MKGEALENIGEWILDHPVAAGMICASALVFPGYQLFRLGMTLGASRAIRSEAAHMASEALGG